MQKHEAWRAELLRSKEMAKTYHEMKENSKPTDGCRLCADKETIQEFKHWRLVPNRFPYDRFFTKSDMLISKRHIDETGLNQPEREELFELKNSALADDYDIVFENMPKQKSIPHHTHYHLVQIKKPD